MAKAMICDSCKKTFANNADERATGRWSLVSHGNRRLVYAVWNMMDENVAADRVQRGGTPLDFCPDCAAKFITEEVDGTPRTSLDDSATVR